MGLLDAESCKQPHSGRSFKDAIMQRHYSAHCSRSCGTPLSLHMSPNMSARSASVYRSSALLQSNHSLQHTGARDYCLQAPTTSQAQTYPFTRSIVSEAPRCLHQ